MHTDTRVDCIVTSPPYLNGTNYIRNTKLELKLGHFIETRQDLAKLHSAGIVAGINNVHVSAQSWKMPKDIQQTVAALEDCAYDRRIPRMVEYYFRDMDMVLERLSHVLRLGGCLFLDVGDSQFAGIHVPTHSYLTCLGALHGLQLTDEFEIRARRSKNGMKLTQRLLQFRKVRRP